MRTIWSGALNLGLANIPVALYRATGNEPLNFHYLRKTNLSPIRFARVCRAEEREVPFTDLVKGFKTADGWVPLADKDFENANCRASKTIFRRPERVGDFFKPVLGNGADFVPALDRLWHRNRKS